MTIRAWPALAAMGEVNGAVLGYARGVWGKRQGDAAGFHWLAVSPGFGEGAADLARRLPLGSEDSPIRAVCWRALPDRFLALAFYPSRAVDAAGRGGILEKQVLEWRPESRIPVALAVLFLLRCVAGWDDRIWWGRQGQGRWEQPGYALPIEPSDCPPLVVDEQAAQALIDKGIADLNAAADAPRLQGLYARLLSNRRPAQLPALSQPLSPEALAVLLLPLPAQAAGLLSLAGWVPSRRLGLQDLAESWDLVATGQRLAAGTEEEADLDAALCERAGRMALALLENAPDLLAEEQAASARPGEAGPHIEKNLLLAELGHFAADPHRRHLDLARLGALLRHADYPLSVGDDPGDHPLCRWVRQTAERRPDWADPAEWGIKVDQLRAATLVFLPHPHTLDLVGLPESPYVPALLPVLACKPDKVGGHLAAHGLEHLRAIVEQSLACPRTAVAARIRAWLHQWQAAVGEETPLGALVAEPIEGNGPEIVARKGSSTSPGTA
jgi:hypothetical protein